MDIFQIRDQLSRELGLPTGAEMARMTPGERMRHNLQQPWYLEMLAEDRRERLNRLEAEQQSAGESESPEIACVNLPDPAGEG